MNIGTPEPRNQPRPERGPRSDGEVLADALMTCPSPLGTQIPVTGASDRELRTAQQSGTRWLARQGHHEWRLSYRRVGTDAVWILTAKPKETP